jgi:hypothetical protein
MASAYTPASLLPQASVQRVTDVFVVLVLQHESGPLARFVSGSVSLPALLLHRQVADGFSETTSFLIDNMKRDVVRVKGAPPFQTTERGPSWFSPVLPGMRQKCLELQLRGGTTEKLLAGKLGWSLSADSAPLREGVVELADCKWYYEDLDKQS